MPNTLDANGLTVKTLSEIVSDLTASFQAIYGADINVASNSPDGQLINVLAQAIVDANEILADVYNNYDPEAAYGVSLDRLVALNGMVRRAATQTVTPVLVTVNQALTLTGIDALGANPSALVYTVQDDTGTEFKLVTTKIFANAGSDTLNFQAVTPGAVEVTANTITQQATVVVGVTAVNNPTTAGTVVGISEETDAALKVRRAKLFKLASTGPAQALEAALLALPGLADAYVIENDTNGTVNSVPAHSIHIIANLNTVDTQDFADAIYKRKPFGCGTYGAQTTAPVTAVNGQFYQFKYDNAVAEPLYIAFTIVPAQAGLTFDNTYLATQLAAALSYKLGDIASIGDVINAMRTIEPRAILTVVGVSLDGNTYSDTVTPSTTKGYFTVAAGDIDIS